MKLLFTLLIGSMFVFSSCDVISQLPGAIGTVGPVTQTEAAAGIKEALAQGLVKAVLQLNSNDGFFGDQFYKVLLPPDAKKVENTLRSIGFGSIVDKAVLSINRGAEDAVGYAKPIFVDAIKSMTLSDAIGLVKNGDTSATHFFRVKTTEALVAAFRPVIQQSLERVDATRYYGDVITKYNNLPTTFRKVNPDLINFVTLKATEALFDLVAKEERNIRTNFGARSTDLLKKVFGGGW